MTRLFTGDFSTGDFSQWTRVINVSRSTSQKGSYPASGFYPATIITEDPDCGYSARFEVRDGDNIGGTDSGDRTEVMGDEASYAAAGTTRWYAFSTKFDSTFPANRNAQSWGVTTQLKSASLSPYAEYGSPVLAFGWPTTDPGDGDGYWYLVWSPQDSPGHGSGGGPIMRLPLNIGQWHDIKMCVHWSQGSDGTVQVWRNSIQETFNTTLGGGGTTFNGQTLCGGPDATGAIIHQGIYRDSATTATEIVYHRGFRIADSEDSL